MCDLMTYSSHVGWVGVVGESLQVTQDTWSKTVGVRWCAQERVHSCVVCGRRRGRLRLARCRVLRTPPPCAEMWCARHRSAVAGASCQHTARPPRATLSGRPRWPPGRWRVVCSVYSARRTGQHVYVWCNVCRTHRIPDVGALWVASLL